MFLYAKQFAWLQSKCVFKMQENSVKKMFLLKHMQQNTENKKFQSKV